MNGTEKQIKWAEDIKNHWIAELTNDIEVMEKIIEKGGDKLTSAAEFGAEIEKNKQAIEKINQVEDAATIINLRMRAWFDWKDESLINHWLQYVSK